MDIKVLRLSELSKPQTLTLGVLLRGDIKPATKDGSTWVCQRLQKAGFWSDESVGRMVDADKDGTKIMGWVGLVDDAPVGLCFTGLVEEGNRQLLLYLVSLAYSEKDQQAIADTIALVSLDGLIAAGAKEITGWFPEQGWAGDYARRVGMKGHITGKPMVVDPNPMLYWTLDAREMQANILSLQRTAR